MATYDGTAVGTVDITVTPLHLSTVSKNSSGYVFAAGDALQTQ